MLLAQASTPWYRKTTRWGQTNITEKDPVRYDIAWWREQWKRTATQGVIINAGGIVAYYPSKFPLHHRAEFLNERDLYGELAKAAHADGLVVLARMDSNRTSEDFLKAHPDWFARNASGEPYRAADKYVTCVSSPYYEEYLPSVLTEIVERSKPEGFTDNSWSGLGRESICYCDHCARRFGKALPKQRDWDDPIYRDWIVWSYKRRIEIWDLNNRATKAAGGPHCIWIGMNSGSVSNQSRQFRDLKEICSRAEMILLDHQARSENSGFQQNGDTGKFIHGLLGWDKLAPESMAMYMNARTSFRVASKPAAEARMWMLAGFAGGIQPWWHHVGAWHEDRRMYRTAEPVMRWQQQNEAYLVNRTPVATVGVVWSQQNTDFYGREDSAELVDAPYRGMTQALIRARIPYLPVHADHIERDAGSFAVLILPNVAAMSDAQCASVRTFAAKGGAVIATGATSRFTEWGDARPDFGLADLFGAHAGKSSRRASATAHSYLRIESKDRKGILAGFEETDILPFGGTLEDLRTEPGVTVPLTYIPPFPVYPPETSWMRQERSTIPALIVNGRVAYLPADLDRLYARENLPDHANLLANLVRWAAAGSIPLDVKGPGLIDCHLYKQPGRLILHLVNIPVGRAPIDEYVPTGPIRVRVKLPAGVRPKGLRTLVSTAKPTISVSNGWAEFELRSIVDHEVIVIGG